MINIFNCKLFAIKKFIEYVFSFIFILKSI
jgi:hypothetical protein